MSAVRNQSFRNTRGAAILEFSLVVLLFFALILIFVDVAHFFLIRMLLVRSAHQALSIASADPRFQLDFRSNSSLPAISATSSSVPSDPDSDYSRYIGVRQQIIQAASSFGLPNLISPPNSGGIVTLTTYSARDEYTVGYSTVAGFPAAVIRPGESWYSDQESAAKPHPGYCSTVVDPSCSKPRPPAMTMEQMLQAHPIIIRVAANKRSFIPGVGTIPIRASAVGWVQIYPKSPYDMKNFLPAESLLATPTPTPCPRDPPDCASWNSVGCYCEDPQTCPPDYIWNTWTYECWYCPLATTGCEGDVEFMPQFCSCNCSPGYNCAMNDPNRYVWGETCGTCLDPYGNVYVGH